MFLFSKGLNELVRSEKRLLTGSAVCTVMTAVLIVIQAYVLSSAVVQFFPEQNYSQDSFTLLVAGFIAASALRAVFHITGQKYSIELSAAIRRLTRQRLLESAGLQGPARIRHQDTGDWLTTMVQRVDALDVYISQYIPQWQSVIVMPVIILFSVIAADWFSAAVLFVTAPLIPLFMVLIGRKAEQLSRVRWLSMSRLGSVFLDRIQGLITLKLIGQSRAQANVIEQSTEQFARRTLEVLRVAFLSGLTLELIASVSIALIAVETGLRLMHGMMDFRYALFILSLAPEFYQPFRMLGVRFHAGMEGITAMEAISEKLNHLQVHQSDSKNVSNTTVPPFRIEFDSVSFRYSSDSEPALKTASFTILPRRRNVMIGPSGSGKSTSGFLMMKWLSADSGTISVNGILINRINPEEWLAAISWISQHPYIFNTTIMENIRFGKPGATDDEIENAAHVAGLTDWIKELPGGFQTLTGERGMMLSQGQSQRIAIARAVLKNAPLLIFDEPAGYLDPGHEKIIAENIDRLSAGKTALIIAHRLQSVIRADHIIVMENGVCTAEGSRDELINRSPFFRKWIERNRGAGS